MCRADNHLDVSWKCPACQSPLRHDGDHPQPKRIYRCHICRLELVANEKTGELDVAPLRSTAPKPD